MLETAFISRFESMVRGEPPVRRNDHQNELISLIHRPQCLSSLMTGNSFLLCIEPGWACMDIYPKPATGTFATSPFVTESEHCAPRS